jgi:hypothetical protein
VVVKIHLKSNYEDAVSNIEATDRMLSTDDEKISASNATHPCDWSAIYSEHMNDP